MPQARPPRQLTAREIRWQGYRYRILRNYFEDNEIIEGRLHKVSLRNKALKEAVKARKRAIKWYVDQGIDYDTAKYEASIDELQALQRRGKSYSDILDEFDPTP